MNTVAVLSSILQVLGNLGGVVFGFVSNIFDASDPVDITFIAFALLTLVLLLYIFFKGPRPWGFFCHHKENEL